MLSDACDDIILSVLRCFYRHDFNYNLNNENFINREKLLMFYFNVFFSFNH